MKYLSIWANKNRLKTILILIPLHVILGYLYFYTGAWFYMEGIKTPRILINIATLLFLAAWLFYPIKNIKQGIYKNTFFRRKFWQGITMVSTALFLIHSGNHISRAAMANEIVEYSAESVVLDSRAKQHFQKKKTRKERRSLRKKLRKRIRANIKNLRQLKKDFSSRRDKIIIGSILLILLFLFGLMVRAIIKSFSY